MLPPSSFGLSHSFHEGKPMLNRRTKKIIWSAETAREMFPVAKDIIFPQYIANSDLLEFLIHLSNPCQHFFDMQEARKTCIKLLPHLQTP